MLDAEQELLAASKDVVIVFGRPPEAHGAWRRPHDDAQATHDVADRLRDQSKVNRARLPAKGDPMGDDKSLGRWEVNIIRWGIFLVFVATFGDCVVRKVWPIVGPLFAQAPPGP